MAIFNRSLSKGQFPAIFKEAFITPALKKPGLDAADVSSYRPISNLSVLSKLLEQVKYRGTSPSPFPLLAPMHTSLSGGL